MEGSSYTSKEPRHTELGPNRPNKHLFGLVGPIAVYLAVIGSLTPLSLGPLWGMGVVGTGSAVSLGTWALCASSRCPCPTYDRYAVGPRSAVSIKRIPASLQAHFQGPLQAKRAESCSSTAVMQAGPKIIDRCGCYLAFIIASIIALYT